MIGALWLAKLEKLLAEGLPRKDMSDDPQRVAEALRDKLEEARNGRSVKPSSC